MRVTQTMTDRRYHNQNNKMLTSMLKNQTRIYSQKQYSRASEDSIKASKAMIVRRGLRNLDMYDDNLSSVKETFSAAESSLYTISNEIYINVQTKLEAACNGTYNKDDLAIYAKEIEEYAELTVEALNTDFAGRTLFGGTNNSTSPFTVTQDANGKNIVNYNGVPVDSNADASTFPGSNPIYVDIGIGIKYNADYTVKPQTAKDVSLNGAEITGCGTDITDDGDVFSKNFVQLMYDAADALNNGDVKTANAILDRLNTANSSILTKITSLGSEQNSMDFYIEKNVDHRTSLQARQNEVEGCDMNEEITDWEATDAAYQAILQMSGSVLPKSIFDFV